VGGISPLSTFVWPILIIGGGPAGLSAAINARKRNKQVMVLAKEQISHKLQAAPKVANYPGIADITGTELGKALYEHASAMGTEFKRDEAQQIVKDGDVFWVMGREEQYQARKLLLAVGVMENKSIPGENEFEGKGVSYCATCDGAFFRGKDVAMIAYLPEAETEARFLAGICRRVYYIPQYRPLPQSIAENVTILSGVPKSITGQETVAAIEIGDQSLSVQGIFIERPGIPPLKLIDGLQIVNEKIIIDENMETNISGVYAAGDCTGRPWQIARAVGQGQIAAIAMAKELDKR
jgi:thioredoxin reductase (NADPH)